MKWWQASSIASRRTKPTWRPSTPRATACALQLTKRRTTRSAAPSWSSSAAQLLRRGRHRTGRTMGGDLEEDRRELDAVKARCAKLFFSAPVAFVTLDASGTIRELNSEALVLLGPCAEALVGAPFSELVVGSDVARFR